MNNVLIEHTRAGKVKHYMIKKFVPVYERLVVKETWGSNLRGGLLYEKGEYNFWQVTPTSVPKKIWPIVRIKRKKAGQLCLLMV